MNLHKYQEEDNLDDQFIDDENYYVDGNCPICGCDSVTQMDDDGELFRCDSCQELFNV